MKKQIQSTPRQDIKRRPYNWLTAEQHEELMAWAREYGDTEGTAEIRARFLEKYGFPITRQTALHWKALAFSRKRARGGQSVILDRDTATMIEELVRAGHFTTKDEVVTEGVTCVYRDSMGMEWPAKEGPMKV